MYKVSAAQTEASPIEAEGVVNVSFQSLLDNRIGAPNFALRRFIIGPGGCTFDHTHEWEHEIYILRGHGTLIVEGEETPLEPDDAILVPGGARHQFRSAADEAMEMICVIPLMEATCMA